MTAQQVVSTQDTVIKELLLSLLCNATTRLTESILLQALLATSVKCKQYFLSILFLSSIVRNLQWLVIVMTDCVTVNSLKLEISAF